MTKDQLIQAAAATAAMLAAYYGKVPAIEAFLTQEEANDRRPEKQPVAQAA